MITAPKSGALWLRNLITERGASIISGPALRQNYALKNLLSPRRSKKIRTVDTSQAQFVGAFKEPALPRGFALIGSNISTPASDLASAQAKAAIWLQADRESYTDGTPPYVLTDRSGNGRHFAVGSRFSWSFSQWHKADAIAVQADGSALDTWLDSGSGGTPAATSTGGRRPTYRSGANGKNGLPIVEFNGSQHLDWGSAINFGTTHTIIVVAKFSSIAQDLNLFGDNATGYLGWVQASGGLSYQTDGSNFVFQAWTPVVGQWYVIAVQRSGTDLRFVIDGVQLSAKTLGSNNTWSMRYLGNFSSVATLGVNGAIAEAIVTTSASDLQTNDTIAFLARKWGLSTTPLPSFETNEQDAKAIVRFGSGSGFAGYRDQMGYDNGLDAGFSLGTSHTLLVLFKLSAINSTNVLLGDGTGGSRVAYTTSGTALLYRAGASGDVSVSTGALSAGVWYLLSIVRSGASVSFYLNGTKIGTTQTLGATPAATAFVIKNLFAYDLAGQTSVEGDFAELFVALEALSDAERIAIQDGIAVKWNTTTVLGSIVLELANDTGFTSAPLRWVLQSYVQSLAAILRWYLGMPDNAGAVTLATFDLPGAEPAFIRSFWRLTLPAGAVIDTDGDGELDDYFQVAVPWLGPYRDLIPAELDLEPDSQSILSEARGGAEYEDRLPAIVKGGIEIEALRLGEGLSLQEAYELLDTLRKQGRVEVVYDPHAEHAANPSAGLRQYGLLYAKLTRTRASLPGGSENALSLSIEETRG